MPLMYDNAFSKFDEILEKLRAVYLNDERHWMLMNSTGKDSTLLTVLTIQMLMDLPPELRSKPVSIVVSDTRVEEPGAIEYVDKVCKAISLFSKAHELPVKMHRVRPETDKSFFAEVIGKGNPPPNSRTRTRWCTSRLKIKPGDSVVQQILAESQGNELRMGDEYDLVMLLGVRLEESASRAKSINDHKIDDQFAKHATYDRVLVYHPIRHVTLNELWDYLMTKDVPWKDFGTDVHELIATYQDAEGECPLTNDGGKLPKSCGGGRRGCWTCCYVNEDRMLIRLIDNGERHLIPLLRWKNMLMNFRNDVRYREPFRKPVMKSMEKEAALTKGQLYLFDMDVTAQGSNQSSFVDTWHYEPGSITLQGRRFLLKTLLHAQEEARQILSDITIIDQEEIDVIVKFWAQEGYEATPSDLQPEDLEYDGPVVFKDNLTLNTKETTCSTPVFVVEKRFEMKQDDVIALLKECRRETGTHVFYVAEPVSFVLTKCAFVVNDKNIATQEQAESFVDSWLENSLVKI